MTTKKVNLISKIAFLTIGLLGGIFIIAANVDKTDKEGLHKSPAIIEYNDSTRRLEITGDTGTAANIYVIGKNEYDEVDTFIEGFVIIPVSLDMNTLRASEYTVIVESDSSVIFKLIYTYY